MKPSNHLHFRIPPSQPRFHSKRSIKAEGEIIPNNFSRVQDINHFDSEKKKRRDPRPFIEEDLQGTRFKDEGSGFNNIFGNVDAQRFKNENSWRERMSSNKNLWRLPESERKLRVPGNDSQNMDYIGLPSFRNYLQRVQSQNVEQKNFNNYFSDRNLMSTINPRKNGKDSKFRLEMLDDSFLKKDKFRHVSMRMICKRDSDHFSNLNMEQPMQNSLLMNPIGSMKIIDEKFNRFSFKSRDSVSQSKVNEEARQRNFSPFPLSKINRGGLERKDTGNNGNDDFLNNLGTGAFKKVVTKDPTTNALTRSDIRLQKNSNILSPFEYNHHFGKNFPEKINNQPIFLNDLNNKGISSNFLSRANVIENPFSNLRNGPMFRNNFNSQRKIQGVYNQPKTNTMSWKHIKIPWSSKQIKTAMSNRRISMNFDNGAQLKDQFNLKNKDLNDSFIKSKKDLLGIETKYINQEGEDKSAIEENLNEKEDLSCENDKNGGFEIFKNFENFKKIIGDEAVEISKRECILGEKEEIFKSADSQNKTSLEKKQKSKSNNLKRISKKIHFLEKIEKKEIEENISSSKKNKKNNTMKSIQNESSDLQYNELKNEKEKMEKIKLNLDESLKEFDNRKEFSDFHNLLGLLSCLFVTGKIEDRYLDLKSDEKSILIAIVYRKFKRTLNHE
jgi:hypothetical protein